MLKLHGDASLEGDYAWIVLLVSEKRITKVEGEGVGVADLVDSISGLTLLEASSVSGEGLAIEALHSALGSNVSANPEPNRVAVAMSGGVDSAIALQMMFDNGFDPVGVTLRLWIDPDASDTEKACCSPTSVREARALCHEKGIPHVTLDLREEFRSAVVDPFIEGYASGLTPNPCVRCNSLFRFSELDRFRQRIGANLLTTGHYAQLVERDGQILLARALDKSKDQSYMLAGLNPGALKNLCFPLGKTFKLENRERATGLGFAASGRPESQEACFLGGSDYREFLTRHGVRQSAGSIVDLEGKEIGRHEGAWRYTAGQRKGLGIGGNKGPLYVIATDVNTATVRVGNRMALECQRVRCKPGFLYTDDMRGEVKLRFQSSAVNTTIVREENGFLLELDEPVESVAPGQFAVIYVDDTVVGAGTIMDNCLT
tara:strand:- start:223 stop:1512 length:1290 start_codon:yes stop_codon:yes gene_type:complete